MYCRDEAQFFEFLNLKKWGPNLKGFDFKVDGLRYCLYSRGFYTVTGAVFTF